MCHYSMCRQLQILEATRTIIPCARCNSTAHITRDCCFFTMPRGGHGNNYWGNSSADQYAYGNYQNQWSHDELQWSDPPQEQPYLSSTYYEPQYADQDHYHNPYPYQDPYEYQHPSQ